MGENRVAWIISVMKDILIVLILQENWLRVQSCHSDDLVLRIWKPLPPYVFDSEGKRLEGIEQCYDDNDMDWCTVPDCQVETDTGNSSNTVEEDSCSNYRCFAGFCRHLDDINRILDQKQTNKTGESTTETVDQATKEATKETTEETTEKTTEETESPKTTEPNNAGNGDVGNDPTDDWNWL